MLLCVIMQENLQLNDSKKISRRFETDANWGSQSKYKGLYIFIYIYIYAVNEKFESPVKGRV